MFAGGFHFQQISKRLSNENPRMVEVWWWKFLSIKFKKHYEKNQLFNLSDGVSAEFVELNLPPESAGGCPAKR